MCKVNNLRLHGYTNLAACIQYAQIMPMMKFMACTSSLHKNQSILKWAVDSEAAHQVSMRRAQLKYKVKSSLYLSLVSQSGQIHRQPHVCHGLLENSKEYIISDFVIYTKLQQFIPDFHPEGLETHDGEETHLQTTSTIQLSPPIKQTTRPINIAACPTASCMLPPGVT